MISQIEGSYRAPRLGEGGRGGSGGATYQKTIVLDEQTSKTVVVRSLELLENVRSMHGI